MLKYIESKKAPVITYEESSKLGGFGSAILEHINNKKLNIENVTLMGIEDQYVHQGTKNEILKELNLDIASIIKLVRDLI